MKPTKLIILVAVVTVCLFATSKMISALSVGYLKVERNDQAGFRGEIPIYLNQSELSKEVQVLLGSESDYTILGEERPALLDDIKITYDKERGSKAVLSSDRPLTDTAFELIVKVMVDGGALLKRFPIVLTEIASEKDLGQAIEKTKEMVKDAVAEVAQKVKEEPSLKVSDQKSYGPVKKGETLWSIATSLSPDRESVGRIAVAIWKKNMDAFRFSNIHGLKSNVYLDCSGIDEAMRDISPDEANRTMALQWKEWKERTSSRVLAKKAPEVQERAPAVEKEPPAKAAVVMDVKEETPKAEPKPAVAAEVRAEPREEIKLHLAGDGEETGSSITFLKPINASITADLEAAQAMDEKGLPLVAAAAAAPEEGGPPGPTATVEGLKSDLEELKKEVALMRVNLAGRIGSVEGEIRGRFSQLEKLDRAFYTIFILENIILIAVILRSQIRKRQKPQEQRQKPAATPRRYVATNLNQRYL